MVDKEKVVTWARDLITGASVCVEKCPEPFKVVAFQIILEWMIENAPFEEE